MDLNILIDLGLEKQKRRSKTDQKNRNYTCGCGKSYLSYPALYTHIKTKHSGVYPEGTISNLISSSKKRGRPKKFLEDEQSPQNILNELEMLGGSSDAKSELVDSPLYSYIAKWENYSDLGCREVCCDDAFAMYLIDTSKLVDPHNFYKIVRFIENFKTCLEHNKDCTACSNTGRLPEKLQYFIQHYIPLYTPSFNRVLAIKLALHFAQWLLLKRLTDVKLTLI